MNLFIKKSLERGWVKTSQVQYYPWYLAKALMIPRVGLINHTPETKSFVDTNPQPMNI